MLRMAMFDLDDTLVDQSGATQLAVSVWAAELGIEGPGVHERWSDVSARHYSRYQRRELTFTEQRRARVRDFLGATISDREADELFAGYLTRYEAGWEAFPDAARALRRARAAGLRVTVLTNGDEDQQRSKVDRLGLTPEVDLLLASSALPASKPDPRAFLAAAEVSGVKTSEILMVGDSLTDDVQAAQAVGIDAVLVDRHERHPEARVRRVRTLDELVFGR